MTKHTTYPYTCTHSDQGARSQQCLEGRSVSRRESDIRLFISVYHRAAGPPVAHSISTLAYMKDPSVTSCEGLGRAEYDPCAHSKTRLRSASCTPCCSKPLLRVKTLRRTIPASSHCTHKHIYGCQVCQWAKIIYLLTCIP